MPSGGLILALLLAACGGGGGGDSGGGGGSSTTTGRGFQIQSPEIDIQPFQGITYCYYFRTPNSETFAIKRWQSSMMPGVHHMIMFTTQSQGQPVDKMPPGTVSAANCGQAGAVISSWVYAAYTPDAEMILPSDDGAGKPLAIEVAANSAAFFQMHFINPSAVPIKVRVTLNAEALDAGLAFTETAAYYTRNNSISIPPNAVGDVEAQSCATPAGAKFWRMSTHAHKQAVNTAVKDGADIVFTSTDWERPGATTFAAPDFYTFATGQLTYECTYDNTGGNANRTITSGESEQTDEMCVAVGYFFPATQTLYCIDGFGPF